MKKVILSKLTLFIYFLSTVCTKSQTINCNNPLVGAEQPACTQQSGCIGGIAFEDYNYDGTRQGLESGVPGVIVNVFNSFNELSGSTITDSDGDWEICGLVDGQNYRVEFTLPAEVACWASPTHVGSDNGSDLQIITVPACANFSLSSSIDYCHDTPEVLANCYLAENPSNWLNDPKNDAIVSFSFLNPTFSRGPFNPQPTQLIVDHTELAEIPQVGATWGLAYNPVSQKAYAASFMKRLSGFGSGNGNGEGSTGAIYEIDVSNPNSVTTLVDFEDSNWNSFNTGPNPHPNSTTDWFTDGGDSYDAVGKISFGDIDLNPKSNELYAMNLFERALYIIPIDNPTPTNVERFTIPGVNGIGSLPNGPAWTVNSCTTNPDAELRPGGITYHKGKVYVAVTCTAELASGDGTNDLHGYVFEFDLSSRTYNATPIIDFAFDRTAFPWSKWKTNWIPDRTKREPWITDVEFVGKNIALGIMDREGHKRGYLRNSPLGTGPLENYQPYGSVIKACYNQVTNTYTVESGGVCGGTTGFSTSNGEGPVGGEFYDDSPQGGHSEDGLGGLMSIMGRDTLATSSLSGAFDGGLNYMLNSNGTSVANIRIYDGDLSFDSNFAKGGGIGDVEAICENAPIEVGNRLWKDENGNGIQDPDESGINNVEIELLEGPTIIATTTTSNGGQFYFNSSNVANGLKPNTEYMIKVKTELNTGALVGCEAFTTPNSLSGASATGVADSDAGTDGTVTFITGNFGENNHTLDIGVINSPPCVRPDAGSDIVICLPKTSIELKNAATGQNWVAATGNPTNASINPNTGEVSGLTVTGIYQFILENGQQNCSDTINVEVSSERTPEIICNDGSQSITLTAEPTLTEVVWFNSSGQQVGVGSDVIIDANTSGLEDGADAFYYIAKDSNACEIELCCWVNVITQSCCPYPNCVGVSVIKND